MRVVPHVHAIRGDTNIRHVRYTHESDTPDAAPAMLDTIWEDLHAKNILSTPVLHALRHVLHISHTTRVQSAVLPIFRVPGNSVFVEAHTGSGKTLAFTLPIVERILEVNKGYEAAMTATTGSPQPYRTKSIHAIFLSPSRELVRQTGIVVRTILGTLPYGAQCEIYAPCYKSSKNALHTPALELRKKKKGKSAKYVHHTSSSEAGSDTEAIPTQSEQTKKRCGGVIFCSTPSDFLRYLEAGSRCLSFLGGRDEEKVVMQRIAAEQQRLVLVIDEADTILDRHCSALDNILKILEESYHCSLSHGSMDMGLFGATLSHSDSLMSFFDACRTLRSPVSSKWSTIQTAVEQEATLNLKNRYVWCSLGSRWTGTDANIATNPSNAVDVSLTTNKMLQQGSASCDPVASRLSYIIHILNRYSSRRHLIFCNSNESVLFLTACFRYFQNAQILHFDADHIIAIHSGLTEAVKHTRYKTFLNLSDGELSAGPGTEKKASASVKGSMLIGTNRAAHGLDIRDVQYVIHFEPPETTQMYIHRVGRIARMGMTGTNIVLFVPQQDPDFKDPEQLNVDAVGNTCTLLDEMRKAIDITEWKVSGVVFLSLPTPRDLEKWASLDGAFSGHTQTKRQK